MAKRFPSRLSIAMANALPAGLLFILLAGNALRERVGGRRDQRRFSPLVFNLPHPIRAGAIIQAALASGSKSGLELRAFFV